MLTHKGTQPIETVRLGLRRFQVSDAGEMFRNWANDPGVTRYLSWTPHASEEFTESCLSGWVEAYQNDFCYNWAMALKETGEVIGSISVVDLREKAESCEIGYCMGKRFWNRGLMTEALTAVVDYLFREAGFHRITAGHHTDNSASGRVMVKSGMRREGLLRQAGHNPHKEELEFFDVAVYAVLREEWEHPGGEKITLAAPMSEYGAPSVVKSYTDAVDGIGLWKSEEILIPRYIAKDKRLLDIGCGAGRTSFGLYRMGYRNLTGLDLSSGMIAACKARAETQGAKLDFVEGNACDMPFENESFDAAIFSFNGLMTIPGRFLRQSVLREIARVLVPGGVFLFTTHDMENPEFQDFWQDERERWRDGRQDPRLHEYGDLLFTDEKSDGDTEGFVHIPEYSEVKEALCKAGLRVIYSAVRSGICEEPEKVRAYSADCKFWICEKSRD